MGWDHVRVNLESPLILSQLEVEMSIRVTAEAQQTLSSPEHRQPEDGAIVARCLRPESGGVGERRRGDLTVNPSSSPLPHHGDTVNCTPSAFN